MCHAMQGELVEKSTHTRSLSGKQVAGHQTSNAPCVWSNGAAAADGDGDGETGGDDTGDGGGGGGGGGGDGARSTGEGDSTGDGTCRGMAPVGWQLQVYWDGPGRCMVDGSRQELTKQTCRSISAALRFVKLNNDSITER